MTTYSGYHPDAFWEVEELEHKMEKLKTEKASKPVVSVNLTEKDMISSEETKEEEKVS